MSLLTPTEYNAEVLLIMVVVQFKIAENTLRMANGTCLLISRSKTDLMMAARNTPYLILSPIRDIIIYLGKR
jgi:hypothetical protein